MKKVSTIGVPFSGNRGSSSMLFSIIQNLPKEIGETLFYVYTYYPRKDSNINTYSNVEVLSGTPMNLLFHIVPLSFIYFLFRKIKIKLPKSLLSKEIITLINSDLYLSVGGTTFSDHKLLKVIFNVLCLLPGPFIGIPMILFTQTMGPFNKKLNKYMAKFILPRARYIIGRGKGSYDNLKKLNLNNIDYAMDGAFTLVSDLSETEHISNKYKPIFLNKKVVGISPNAIVEAYCKKSNINHAKIYGDFINYLIKNKYYPVLIPHSMKLNTKNRHNNDIPVIEDILNYVMSKEYLFIKEEYSYIELRTLIGLTDYYVASRFHSMISALYTRRPLLVFGWGSQKYMEVMQEYGLDDYVFDFKEIDLQNIISGFEKTVKDKNLIIERIKKNEKKIIDKSYKAFQIIELKIS